MKTRNVGATDEDPFYIGFMDGIEGRPSHPTCLAYLRGFDEGKLLREMKEKSWWAAERPN